MRSARAWETVPAVRKVLGVIHNVTSATRLLDLLAVFEGDPRVAVVFTCTGSSAFGNGIAEFIADHELGFLPWEQARDRGAEFQLAMSTSRGGPLEEVTAPLIGCAHGAGYNKKLSKDPEPGAGVEGAGSGPAPTPGSGPGTRSEAFGLSAEWLLHDGLPIPSAIALSHDEQLARLRHGCPEALPRARVIGDPVVDELRASLPFRREYRSALGIRPEQKLLLVTSTWGPHSLLGSSFGLAERALAELPQDEYRVLAAIHPNAWYEHGGHQIRNWLGAALRAGLILPHPAGPTWKAALCAADAYVGDHGSLSLYAAALGLPGLLAAFDEDAVAPGSPMAWLGRTLPRVCGDRPLAPQLDRAVRLPDAAARVTSRPGESLGLLRGLCYEHLGLAEPAAPCPPRPVPLPVLPPAARSPLRAARYVDARLKDTGSGALVTVRRYPAEVQGRIDAHLGEGAHLVADEAETDPRRRDLAEILLARGSTPAELFARHPACALVVTEDALLCLRDGRRYAARGPDPAAAASALLTLVTQGRTPEGEFTLRLGGAGSLLTLLPIDGSDPPRARPAPQPLR
ncbi:hypothetical protein ABZY31_18885 [Streptomyces sp. NPDC006529]|uniref:hypothetical protein n=1 Tax=Streptomyces sp. NPDC006529 TaxID=3157177 RepID=UPI00339F4EA0